MLAPLSAYLIIPETAEEEGEKEILGTSHHWRRCNKDISIHVNIHIYNKVIDVDKVLGRYRYGSRCKKGLDIFRHILILLFI